MSETLTVDQKDAKEVLSALESMFYSSLMDNDTTAKERSRHLSVYIEIKAVFENIK